MLPCPVIELLQFTLSLEGPRPCTRSVRRRSQSRSTPSSLNFELSTFNPHHPGASSVDHQFASVNSGILFLLILLRTLLHSTESYLPCFQANPHSLRKTTRVGVAALLRCRVSNYRLSVRPPLIPTEAEACLSTRHSPLPSLHLCCAFLHFSAVSKIRSLFLSTASALFVQNPRGVHSSAHPCFVTSLPPCFRLFATLLRRNRPPHE
jgi:hypothetical protein